MEEQIFTTPIPSRPIPKWRFFAINRARGGFSVVRHSDELGSGFVLTAEDLCSKNVAEEVADLLNQRWSTHFPGQLWEIPDATTMGEYLDAQLRPYDPMRAT